MQQFFSPRARKWTILLGLFGVGLFGIVLFTAAPARTQSSVPRPDHIVIVMEENHSYSEIIGSSAAPYINSLAQQGASFTNSHAVTHPSEPNYLAFFSGSAQGVTDDNCGYSFGGPDLGSELIAAGLAFGG